MRQIRILGQSGKSILSSTIFFCCILASSSCSDDNIENAQKEESMFVSYANFAMEPYTISDDEESTIETRSALHYKIDKVQIHSYWDKENNIGVFPINPRNSQIKFNFVSDEEDTEKSSVVFKGAGWGLQKGNSYAAYYPYKDVLGSTNFDQIPMVFSHQVQNGNNNLDHIGSGYDFMYAAAQTAVDSEVTFNFKHINGLYKVELYPPIAATWTSLSLTNLEGDEIFCDSATLNVATGEVTRVRNTCGVTLQLEDVVTKTDKDTITLYISTVPISASGQMIVTLRDDKGRSYYDVTKNTYMRAGKYSTLHKRPLSSNRIYVDLGLPSGNLWSICNLGAILPWEQGFYYGWGTLWPVSRYYWDNYRFSFDKDNNRGTSLSQLYKYTIPDGFVDGSWYQDGVFCGDGKKVLEQSYTPIEEMGVTVSTDDAAQYSWGGDWQVPTADDFNELLRECTYQWVTDAYDANGYLFTGPNGNQMFLPASGWAGLNNAHDESNIEIDTDKYGFYYQTGGEGVNTDGYYWTCNLSDDYSFDAKEFKFNTKKDWRDSTVVYAPVVTTTKRYAGCTIRPVMHKK